MSSKKRSGGRVTPKGTQPSGKSGTADQVKPTGFNPARDDPGRPDQSHGRSGSGPIGPTRSGHHHGNR